MPNERLQGIVNVLKEKFVQPGGVVTTLKETKQQWDAPNGWAPLQWLTVKGLQNYGQDALAKDIADRWISLNVKVFKETGKLMEKYDVQDTSKLAGGGEYPGQDGFGWTNGVLLKPPANVTSWPSSPFVVQSTYQLAASDQQY